MRDVVTRFAPSPSGHLHLGHVYSAKFAEAAAAAEDGRFLLRIEDIDTTRCRPEFEAAIYEDLAWLGFSWAEPVRRQSDHLAVYGAALQQLVDRQLAYPCFCTRRDIAREIAAAGNAPHGREGPLYPGTCRHLSADQRGARLAAGVAHAMRFDAARAASEVGPLEFHDQFRGRLAVDPACLGDVVIARKDIATSYHLAVVVDDAAQGVSLVTRGDDLLAATHVQRLLQAALALPAPDYAHHPLLLDGDGKRFAKRDRSLTVAALRAAGHGADQVRAMAVRREERAG